jgi:hypothetical protein
MRRRNISELTKRIATELMKNGAGKKAERLQLRGKDEKDLGGMCRDAVEWVIQEVIDQGGA